MTEKEYNKMINILEENKINIPFVKYFATKKIIKFCKKYKEELLQDSFFLEDLMLFTPFDLSELFGKELTENYGIIMHITEEIIDFIGAQYVKQLFINLHPEVISKNVFDKMLNYALSKDWIELLDFLNDYADFKHFEIEDKVKLYIIASK